MNEILPIPPEYYSLIGKILVLAIVGLFVMLFLGIALGLYQTRKRRIILPRFVLFVLNLMYRPARMLLANIHTSTEIVNQVGIDLINYFNEPLYAKTPLEKRLAVFPHCLRDMNCPARTDSRVGLLCLKCGRCGLGFVKEIADRHDVPVYIVSGSSFVKRIVKEKKPSGMLAVACHQDLYEVMRSIYNNTNIPIVGVQLSKDGCIETEVNWTVVVEKLLLGTKEDPKAEIDAAMHVLSKRIKGKAAKDLSSLAAPRENSRGLQGECNMGGINGT